MKKSYERISTAIIALCVLFCSCTVLEDRGPCPCHLNIYLGNSAEHTDKLSVSGWSTDSKRLFYDKINPAEFPDYYTKKVQKGYITVSAFCGNVTTVLKNDMLLIPSGKQGDRIWAYSGDPVNAEGETAEDHIVLHKQYADIHIRINDLQEREEVLVLRAIGNTEGISVLSLRPEKGRFSCFVEKNGDGHWILTVPRQYDSSLKLELLLNGLLKRTVPIGELIKNSGYSWSEEDLADIYISISPFNKSNIEISIKGWDIETHTFTI